ncbi:hemopexin repeat-containing protein [Accumulibacter sp.]|uniref:hemopexin repeat-containing protein n=1 Tax=Accumulibacter sp. TaxID=2053492 RepID=UPI002623C3E4|nr:hemopexin repeat-containing protein [Accumulibacter sp.]
MALNQRLINEVAVGVVLVQGPTSDLQMTNAERLKMCAEVEEGLAWLATLEPQAKVSWVYDCKTVSTNQVPWPNAPWAGLPREMYQKSIDAVLWRESNGKIYMFNGPNYVRLTGSTADAGYPKPIAGNWQGLPAVFNDGIDAAFWRKTNGKIYLFKGDQYVRLTETQVDAGYPKSIAGNWMGIPGTFEEGIDAVFMHSGTNKIYMFKGDKYIRLTGSTMDAGYPKPIKGNFKGLPEHMEEGIQSAFWRGSNDKVYFFARHPRRTLTDYVRFSDITQTVDAGYPRYVGGLDKAGAEALWRDPVQAELGVASGEEGYKEYVAGLREEFGTEWGIVIFITKYPVGWVAYAGTPRIVMAWSDSPNFDRVVAHETGHTFGAPDEYASSKCNCADEFGRFFRAANGNCKLCATAISMDDGYPKGIAGSWSGLPASFQSGLDAALWREDNKKAYFFKGNEYVRLSGTTADAGYPKPIAGNWNGLPASFESGIDAACWRKTNNKIYLFKGNQYVRLSGTTVDAGYPKPIAGNWKDLPASFQSGVDAVVWRESNDKIYMFKGSEYVRITDTTMDAGYPRPIAGNWKGLPASFTNGISAGFTHRERKAMYLFDGSQFVRMSDGVPCLMSSNSSALCSFTPLHFGWGAFLSKIDAAVWRKDNDHAYLFSGEWYVRYSNISNGIDEGYPKKIAGNWTGLPSEFLSNLDAALYRDSNNKLYLFKGSKYVRMTGSAMDEGYPKPIAGNWNGLPVSFQQGIDAAFLRESNGKIYLFKGDQYVRLTETTVDPGYPKPIAGNWTGLPSSFNDGIDAALMRWDMHQIYFFRNRQYVRYTNVENGIDPGYPNWIDKNWMPFPT